MTAIIEGKPSGAAPARLLQVDAESSGQRLDNFLLRHLKGVPKTHVYRIIRSGEVRLNKGRTSADARVAEGDLVRLPPVRVAEKPALRVIAHELMQTIKDNVTVDWMHRDSARANIRRLLAGTEPKISGKKK